MKPVGLLLFGIASLALSSCATRFKPAAKTAYENVNASSAVLADAKLTSYLLQATYRDDRFSVTREFRAKIVDTWQFVSGLSHTNYAAKVALLDPSSFEQKTFIIYGDRWSSFNEFQREPMQSPFRLGQIIVLQEVRDQTTKQTFLHLNEKSGVVSTATNRVKD